jgi:hypothetical protein
MSGWTVTIAHWYHPISLSNKKKQATDRCNHLDEYQENYTKQMESSPKGYTLYDFIYIPKIAKYRNVKHIKVARD